MTNARARIEVLLDERQGVIPPDNFGYLLEVIGSSIYDGVWVGETSTIPNIGGIRKSVIDHLKAINTSVIRWPGGCFASAYDWRDGIGHRDQRPVRTSYWNDYFPTDVPIGPQRFDPNLFGTDEFMALCRLTGGRPFLCANTRSLEPNVFDRWLEYCNSPEGSTTLAHMRARAGSPEPYNVRYWSIGNEAWGSDCGLTVDEYVETYKRFANVSPRYDAKPIYVACGAPPGGANLDWISDLIDGVNRTWRSTPMHAISVHYYAGLPANNFRRGETHRQYAERGNNPTLPHPNDYDLAGWYEMLAQYQDIEGYIEAHWDILSATDSTGQLKLAVDEWGAILAKGTEVSPVNYWSRAVTLRDVLGAALTLDILNRHSDKVMVACFTGLINQEGGLFIAEGDRFVASGVYHLFKMYAAHQGGLSVPLRVDCPSIRFSQDEKPKSIWGLNGSASLRDRTLSVTVVNPHASEARETSICLHGGSVRAARLETISHADLRAQNTFEDPFALHAVETPVVTNGCALTCVLPAASVNKLTLGLT